MQYKSLNSQELLDRISELVIRERTLTLEIIRLLTEIERRKLHAERGFSSLFEFAVRVLGYSEGAASRRIRSMRLIQDVPEAENALIAGQASLSTLSSLQSFFQNEPREFTADEKRALLQKIQGKSKRDCDKFLMSQSIHPVRTYERETVIAENLTEICFAARDELMQKFRRIRNLSAHINPNPSYAELFDWMSDLVLQKLEKSKKLEKQKTGRNRKTSKNAESGLSAKTNEIAPSSESEPNTPLMDETTQVAAELPTEGSPENLVIGHYKRKAIPAATQRLVWKRDEGKCQYRDPITGRCCHSEFRVQFEHIIPVFQGGTNAPENLQLLCRTHNLLRAKQLLGELLMSRFLRPRKQVSKSAEVQEDAETEVS